MVCIEEIRLEGENAEQQVAISIQLDPRSPSEM